jgi:AAA15 family ATPase/GTPase
VGGPLKIYVKSIEVQNFKAIGKVKFDLDDVNLIVGPNNSGKSSTLQAIHLAATLFRQASEANKDSSISLNDCEYIPSEDYRELGHNLPWGNAKGTPESVVKFVFRGDFEGDKKAEIVIKSARNEGLSLKPKMDQELIQLLRSKDNVFTSYIPGISGIPVKEERISRLHVYRKAASGDSNVVLRNILNILKEENKLDQLKGMVKKIYDNFEIKIKFDESRDYYISALVQHNNTSKPLEFSGTGLLQVLQVLSYLVLFQPALLLIDEPESHLHPTLQTKLVRALQELAAKQGSRIILTSHSPYVVRGLGANARMIWLKTGKVIADSKGNEIRDALGWGAMDKKVLLITEDRRSGLIERIVKQVPIIDDRVAVVPFEGVTKLGSATGVENLRNALGKQHEVIVHRDRDCLLDNELEPWRTEFKGRGIHTWVTAGTEIESYFCDPDFIAFQEKISVEDSRKMLMEIVDEHEEKLKKEFIGKRQVANKFYEKTGGSPSFDELWSNLDILEKVKGKTLLSKWREKIDGEGLALSNPLSHWEGYSIAPDLLGVLFKLAFAKKDA